MNNALLIVDPQLDFMPRGALAVPDGDKIIEPLNRVIDAMGGCDVGEIFMSLDWHPEVTSHFDKWPVHCRKGYDGAYPPDNLNIWELFNYKWPIFYKGFKENEDCYSAFDGFNQEFYSLQETLITHRITELYVGGLATDYCVMATVLDALKMGFKVSVLADCVKAVDINSSAITHMSDSGARFINSDQAIKEILSRWA